jgi:hypothetical protein
MSKAIQSFEIRRLGGDASPIYQLTSPGDTSAIYTIEASKSRPHLRVTKKIDTPPPYYDPPPQIFCPPNSIPTPNYTVGTADFHSLSSEINVSFLQNGDGRLPPIPISMKRPDPLASGRKFPSGTPLGVLEWKEESLISNGQVLLDKNKRILARYGKKKSSMLQFKKEETFELCVPGLEPYLDLVILTGFASIDYRRRSNQDWDAVESVFDILGL